MNAVTSSLLDSASTFYLQSSQDSHLPSGDASLQAKADKKPTTSDAAPDGFQKTSLSTTEGSKSRATRSSTETTTSQTQTSSDPTTSSSPTSSSEQNPSTGPVVPKKQRSVFSVSVRPPMTAPQLSPTSRSSDSASASASRSELHGDSKAVDAARDAARRAELEKKRSAHPDPGSTHDMLTLVSEKAKIPAGLIDMLRRLPDPGELAPLLRSVIHSAECPLYPPRSSYSKSVVRLGRVGLAPGPGAGAGAGQRPATAPELSHKIHAPPKLSLRNMTPGPGQGATVLPTFRLEPTRTVDFYAVEDVMRTILQKGTDGLKYSDVVGLDVCRVLVATIISEVKILGYDRYKIAAFVRLEENRNQGFEMSVDVLWDADFDRLAYVSVENAFVSVQAVVFLVYCN